MRRGTGKTWAALNKTLARQALQRRKENSSEYVALIEAALEKARTEAPSARLAALRIDRAKAYAVLRDIDIAIELEIFRLSHPQMQGNE